METVVTRPESRRGRKRKINNVDDPVGVGGKRKVMHTRSLELVGRYVQKEFKGSGVVLGRITKYDSGLYRINYEDGRCEDLINHKIRAILVKDGDLTGEWSKRKDKLNGLLSSKESSNDAPSLSGGTNSCTVDELDEVQNDGNNDVTADSSSDSCEGNEEVEAELDVEVPPPELPPSSGHIGVAEEFVPHLLSVYSFLRSFSVRLFLYPFELDDFVGALNCSVANTLLDSVHVALICFLKRQFEKSLSDDSNHASKVLSRLDWSLVDTLTWPIYLVHYLMAMGYTNEDEWKELHTHCMERDYYALSVGKKLTILQILCDNVLDTEELRAEIDIREQLEVRIDIDPSMPLQSCDIEAREGIEKHQTKHSLDNNCMESQVGTSVEDDNGDECRLCGMEGVLICCDGCPLAYHSRCLGLNKTPNGSWHCPECRVNGTNTKSLQRTALRGADVLGVDQYQQVFVASFDHLLVVKTAINSESCPRYYNRQSIPQVIGALYAKPEYAVVYGDICRRIMRYWELSADIFMQYPSDDLFDTVTITDCHVDSNTQQCEILKTMISEPASSSSLIGQLSNHCASSQQSNSNMTAVSTRSSIFSSVNDTTVEAKGSLDSLYMGSSFNKTSYINRYLHGDFSASASANLAILSNDENQVPESHSADNHQKVTCNIALQMKAFSAAAARFFWPNVDKQLAEVPRERCSWCVSCTAPLASKRGCLLNAAASNAIRGAMKGHASGRPVKKCGDERLSGIKTYIMFMEESLCGLVVGPFLNDTFRKQWHLQLEKATTFSETKILLLELEENIRSIALSGDWTKLVEGFSTQSCTSEIAPVSTQKCRPGRPGRRAKKQTDMVEVVADGFKKKLPNFTWWRGGIVSKLIFQNEILPSSSIKKPGRQGGKRKIPGVCYVEGNVIPRISRQVVWRCAVEKSRTVAHLALQVRYLDLHVRWGDLGNAKHDMKSSEAEASAFRNAFIYGKKVVGQEVRYRVGFGSRKHLPLRVMKNIREIEREDEKEIYWFSESFTPLYLIREYEQKAERNKSVNVLSKLQRRRLKANRENIFSSLLWKQSNTARSCCSCHQDVFYRNAAKCHACQGFCHQQCATASTVNMSDEIDFVVICKQCSEAQAASQVGRTIGSPVIRQDTPNSSVPKEINLIPCKGSSTSLGALEFSSEVKSINSSAVSKKNTKSNWGLLWRKKNCEDTGFDFRLKNILMRGNTNRDSIKPRCHLCSQPYNADLMYIHCETCDYWYHADAVELDESKIFSVVGFKCSKCRKIKTPPCPYYSMKRNALMDRLEQHIKASMLEISAVGFNHRPTASKLPRKEEVIQAQATTSARQETALATKSIRDEETNHTQANAATSMQDLSPCLEQQFASSYCFNDVGGHMNNNEPPENVIKINMRSSPSVSVNGTPKASQDEEKLHCKFCSKTATDLCCQICSVRIHKICSPWFEWSTHEDDWRCGSCREWS